MDIFNKKAKESEQTTGKLDDVFRALSPSAITAVAGITALVASVKSLSQASIANYAHFEKLEMGLTTFFQSADKGKSKFEELRKLSNETTFGVDELTDSFTQLANVGVDVDSIKGKLTMLGDLAQGDKAKFAELTSIYAKINSVGKAGAMQLQQIASRGIPIYDMLKKIGVQGTATANDITKAFEEMTKEGGQFYNAMNNINETIEGKQGFISDYLKEMSVNFAEVTGLADIYKDALDVLKEAIGAVSDKLLEWNQNPVMKAIISGLFVGAIASIATALLTSLIPTLATVIAKLTTIRLLEGAKGWAVLAVAGISVAVGAYASYSKSLKKATEDNEKLKKAVEETKKAMGNNYGLLNVGVNTTNTAVKSRDSAKNSLEAYKKNLEGFEEKLKDAEKAVSDIQAKMNADGGGLTGYEGRLEQAQKKVEEWKTAVQITTNSIKEQTTALKFWESEVQKLSVDTLATQFEEIYNSTLPKEQAEIESLKSQLATVLEYEAKLKSLNGQKDANGNIIDYNKSKQAIDDTIRYLENKLKGINAWEDIFKNVTGISVPKVGSDGKSRGQIAGEEYKTRTDKLYDAQVKAKKLLGDNDAEKNVAREFVQNIEKQIESLISNIDVDQPFAETDATITALNEELEKYKEIVGEVSEKTLSFSDVIEQWKQSDNVGTMAGGYGMSALASASSDGSNFLNGMAQSGGNWIGGVINMLIGALANVASSCENFERAMNPITTAFKKLKPLLQVFIDIGADFTTGLEMILNILKPIINVLGFLARILRAVGTVVNLVFYALQKLADGIAWVLSKLGISIDFESINQALDDWFDDMDEFMGVEKDVTDAKKKELEELRRAKEAYDSLLGAMKENEEWYIRQKTALNANTRKEGYQSVNDMILTPQGQFSTHPDDYIIATKNPQSLGGGAVVNVNIQNNASDVEVKATPVTRNGMQEIMIQISKKIAEDVANGANGWDSALSRQSVRQMGRSLSF